MRYIATTRRKARGYDPGIYYSLAVALPMGLASPAAGWLYEGLPQWSYLIMALFAPAARSWSGLPYRVPEMHRQRFQPFCLTWTAS